MTTQKGTIIGLRQLKKTFYKFVQAGATYAYNSNVISKSRLLQLNNNVKIILKDYIKVNVLDLDRDVKKIYNFISSNFLEQETYRIKIPIALMKWFFQNCKIVALENDDGIISMAVFSIQNVQINEKLQQQINLKLICTDKIHRNKRYATKLLAIVQKECVENNNLSAMFMSNIGFMKEFCKLKYYYRPINPEILMTAGFSGFKEADFKNNEKNLVEYFKITDTPSLTLKKLNKDDKIIVEKLFELYNESITKYNFTIHYSKEEFENMLLNDILETYYVYENDEIVDFDSYYKVYHESVVNNKRRDISVANLFMYTTQSVSVYKLIKNLLIELANNNVDLVTILDNMENDYIIETLRFIDSQSFNHIYLFNWNVTEFKANQIGSIPYF